MSPLKLGAGLRKGLYYDPFFVRQSEREAVLRWLNIIQPIWEMRYSTCRPLAPGQIQRPLLRPVYWLGNWQFACLDYYRPPHGVHHRCVRAEPFPPVLARWVSKMEALARSIYPKPDRPARWRLNTCLVNFYGGRWSGERKVDTARVGEHKDFEPGPVASVSLGERALFQFVTGRKQSGAVAYQQWLEDGSLQIFGGSPWKDRLFHRVQRVEDRGGHVFRLNVSDFETRRINFTFRYVPPEHVVAFSKLSQTKAADVREYMEQLAKSSSFFRRELSKGCPAGKSEVKPERR